MANQFNTTHHTQTTSDNTPTSAEFLGQAIFTGDEWQTLINALDNYESQISDLAEVMPADDQTATTAHPVTGEPVSREAIANELECFAVLNDIIHDQTLSNCRALNLTASVYNDFGHIDDDQLEAVDIGFTVNKILVNAIFYACYQAKTDSDLLYSTKTSAKDKATKKAIKHLNNALARLASINNKLANAIYDIRLDLAQSQADTGNHIVVLLPHEAVTLWRDEWFIYFNAYKQASNAPNQSQAIDEAVKAIARNAQAPLDMARQCVIGALDYNTQTTSDNTPTSAEFLGQAIFTGDEWQTLINALDNYESQISDLAEVMPADDQTATTAHPVTGEPVSREAIANELECFAVLNDIIHDQTLSNCRALNLTASVYNDFGHIDDDQLEAVDIGFTVNKILVNAIFYACYQAKTDSDLLYSTKTSAKDKATKKAIKHLNNALARLASINNKLANAIYDIRLDLAQSQADTGNHIVVLLPHEAVTLWRDEWFIYFNAYKQASNAPNQSQAIDEAVKAIARNAQAPLDMARQCVIGALDYNTQTTSDNTPTPELDSNTLAYIQRLESESQQLKDRLKRQRINHSDSITTSICHLEYIKANLQALESVTFDNNPNFEDSQEYLLFASLNYLIGSYIKDRLSEQNQLGQGGNHASL